MVAHYATGLYATDLHPEDIYWCTADPGWVTGTSYGIIAPLVHGVTVVVDEEELTLTGGTASLPNSTSQSGTRLRRRCGC